ncbi:MAG: hypothetical protein LBS91_06035 [Clostridiales Family XIII bacterium]|jgi:hypothetical protein|nr:hypothetical protein [Clostridiales Family XIII bacterium]
MTEYQVKDIIQATMNPVVTAAVVAACATFITFVGNAFIAISNNRRLSVIEKDKFLSELVQYRYTKLYSILEDLQKEHGHSLFPDDDNRTASEAVSKRPHFVELYKLARPLIDTNLRTDLDNSADEEAMEYARIIEAQARIVQENADIQHGLKNQVS